MGPLHSVESLSGKSGRGFAQDCASLAKAVTHPDIRVSAVRGRVAAVVVAVGLTCIQVPTSFAAPPVLRGSFDGKGLGVTLRGPTGLAVDLSAPERAGNVLVVDSGENVVDVFGATGGLPSGEVPSQITHGFVFADEPAGVAIDTSAGPMNGDVYVDDIEHGLVERFRPSGSGYEYVCTISGYGSGCLSTPGPATEAFVEPDGLAVDSHGDVFVSDYGNDVVDEFDPTGGNVRQIRGSSEEPFLGHPSGLAFDGAGDLYVQQYAGQVLRFEANLAGEVAPEETPTLLDPGTALGVAVDPASGTVYVAHKAAIFQYGPSGNEEGEFGSDVLKEARGVAVNPATHEVYVADAGNHEIDIYGEPPTVAPTVEDVSVVGVSANGAELRALLNPNYFDSSYHFEYGTSDCGGGACTSVPAGDVDIGAAGGKGGAASVGYPLQSLQPGTTYFYRVVAKNANGTTSLPQHTFTTSSGGGQLQLPDGRGWEMVSPLDKGGGDILGMGGASGGGIVQASANGEAATYLSYGVFGRPKGAPGGSQYISTRGVGRWTAASLVPPMKAGAYPLSGGGSQYRGFSEDLSTGVLGGGARLTKAGVENPPLTNDAPPGYEDFYMRNTTTGGLSSLLTSAPPEQPNIFVLELVGASRDLSNVIIQSHAALTPEAVDNGAENYYEWSSGSGFEPVNVLPGGGGVTTPGGYLGGFGGHAIGHAVSDSGSRVVWTATSGAATALYVRERGIGTVQADVSHGEGESGRGEFWTASYDGGKVIFTDGSRLTKDATTASGQSDLYEFDTESGRLVDLAVDHNPVDVNGAKVNAVLGASGDGSYVYFVAQGALSAGAVSGNQNVYVWHEGEPTRFIAALSPADEADLSPTDTDRPTRVSPDGRHLLFVSSASLTGYDNLDAKTGARDSEVYQYDWSSNKLTCVSCDPTGARPNGSSSIPAGTPVQTALAFYESRVLTDDGARVFFETSDGLVPQDTNGRRDVYEWEGEAAHLISGGTESEDASFVDASEGGNDVFFITRQSLVPGDTDRLVDLYDARAPHVPGEVVSFSEPPPPAAPCVADGCRGSAAPAPVLGAPASMTFGGEAPDANPPAKAKPKATGKPKHKAKAKRKAKRTAAKRHKRARRASRSRARANRGGK